ncbi:unnamed protein product [Hydatigera taeniaeformis]|uniref:Uncharacterized protein n=1 Tax=Hydatigena taeniaeformis TaxID=6205 RepID=A0A0R3XDK5_HYDTA|nr:unnamed protein product [Hydatigera taeniaeformis]
MEKHLTFIQSPTTGADVSQHREHVDDYCSSQHRATDLALRPQQHSVGVTISQPSTCAVTEMVCEAGLLVVTVSTSIEVGAE